MTSIAQTYRLNAVFIYGLFAVATLSLVAYLVLMVATIYATSSRSSATHRSAALTSQIGELEQTYLTLQGRVSPQQAEVLGLISPERVSVISSSKQNLSLSN